MLTIQIAQFYFKDIFVKFSKPKIYLRDVFVCVLIVLNLILGIKMKPYSTWNEKFIEDRKDGKSKRISKSRIKKWGTLNHNFRFGFFF